MKSCFSAADILLPGSASFEKWAVIACDQFTSDHSYWERVEKLVGDAPSTLNMIFPEIYLHGDTTVRIANIASHMDDYQKRGVFDAYPASFGYVERTLLDGSIRPGIVGMVDLEQYHYDPGMKPVVGATEQTVLERIPPRIAVRREASLEFPHVILFCNDAQQTIIEPIRRMKDQLPKLYDFMLMEDGGRICGWLVNGQAGQMLQDAIDGYLVKAQGSSLLVADGNHSLVTAKCWYEELKEKNPGQDLSAHPARYALVELENILDPSVVFEPIHRVIFNTDPEKFLSDIETICTPDGNPVQWVIGQRKGILHLDVPEGELTVSVLQKFLDSWLDQNAGRIDYIHDADAAESLASNSGAIGLMLPAFDKGALFAFGASGKILPRKTFSLGHGREKRYYMEGRRIK